MDFGIYQRVVLKIESLQRVSMLPSLCLNSFYLFDQTPEYFKLSGILPG